MNIEGFCLFLIFSFLAMASFYISRLLYGDYFAPLGIFLGINLLSLSLYHLKLIPLKNLSLEAYGLIALSFYSFGLGVVAATSSIFIIKTKSIPAIGRISNSLSSKQALLAFYYITAILATSGWLFLLFNYLSSYSLKDIHLLQYYFQSQPFIGYLNLLGILVLPIFFLLKMIRCKITVISIFFVLSAIIGLFLAGIKTYFIFSLVVSFLVVSIFKPSKLKFKHLLALIFLVLAFFIAYNQLIDIFIGRNIYSSIIPEELSFLRSPYGYITGPWPAMSTIMENPPDQPHWGFVTFHFLWKIMGAGLGLIPSVPNVEPGVDIGASSNFNVYGLIGGIYWDFGVFGPLFGCFILAFISTRLYLAARKYRNWITIICSSVFSYGLFISFFLYYYRIHILFLILYIIIIGKFSKKIFLIFPKKVRLIYKRQRRSRLKNISEYD